ncbi:FIST signal transduction protein [Roseibacillus persicicus]|uniref:Histidine kinase n=1 Tax=Roseibacillus persicicus TaxID=454148 RepID=A0A918WFT9_9BACT|nr:FIST N-terminal domain-containing protein [Roseibacillus persicicus]GHC43452.1 hypothetical protein GCM10007100_05740 [Roseibacillus persicicus]
MKVHQRTLLSVNQEFTAFPAGGESQLLLVFAPRSFLTAPGFLDRIRESCPEGTRMAGCSTAGEICSEGVLDEVATLTFVQFASTRVEVVREAVAEEGMAPKLKSESLGGKLARRVHDTVPEPSYLFILSDGLYINGSDLVASLEAEFTGICGFSGGLAGDGESFEETIVVADFTIVPKTCVAVVFKGDRLKAESVAESGWSPFGTFREVTSSEGNCLKSLDGESALEVYSAYLGEEAKDLPASGLLYPLEVTAPGSQSKVIRTVFGVDRGEKTMSFAGDVPQGSSARLMSASYQQLVDGAGEASRKAASALPSADLAILVSCGGRRLAMSAYTDLEVETVKENLMGEVPVCGFYSYGEIAPSQNATGYELHNQTMTITLLKEEE